jgi:hypothetical protein
MSNPLKSNKATTVICAFFFSIFGIQSSYADPGRTLEINVNASTYANINPTNLSSEVAADPFRTQTVYKIYGVRASDTIIFNASNVSNQSRRGYYEIVGYFRDSAGFSTTFSKNSQSVSPNTITFGGSTGYILTGEANLDSYRLEVTLGQDPDFFLDNTPNTPTSGFVGFPSDSNGLYYLWELYSSEAPAPAPAPAASIRRSTNLTFKESLHGTDTLSDPDGQLRKTVDQIMAKYGSLIK